MGSWELAVVVAGIREEVSLLGSSGIFIPGILDNVSLKLMNCGLYLELLNSSNGLSLYFGLSLNNFWL